MAEKFFITESFEKFAGQPFLITGDLSLSYAETFSLIKQTIPVVHNLPVGENRFVGIYASPSVHTILNIFAVMLSGNIAVLLSDKEPESKLQELLGSIDCCTIFDKQSLPADTVNNSEKDLSLHNDATILFSSGSTQTPKAILHTFANHFYSALGSNENIKLSEGDRWLLSLPLSHVSGLSILFRTLLAGAAVVVQDRSLSLSKNIEKYSVTHLSLVETQLREVVESNTNTKSLKSVLVGGSMISKHLIKEAFDKKIPIRTTYGSTEMSSQITTTGENDPLAKLYTSGKLLSHRNMKLGDDGEILVRGETLFKEYLNVDFMIDKDGWFHTSDIGSIDSDGYLSVIGRKDNMFISGGENIYPEEIESHLMNSSQFIKAVIVESEDEKFGFVPVLFYDSDNRIEPETIQQYLSDKLPKFKIPKKIYNFPKDYKPAGMKVDRKFLREWVKKHY